MEYEKRTETFERNMSLESLLKDVNSDLWQVEQNLLQGAQSDLPIVFIMGPHRSGSTLMLQWLADSSVFAYPTNLLSRFYNAPIIGAKLQLLLADSRFNYRDELKDFHSGIDFKSENGKTKGALAPNEFWYFWRRFLPYKDIEYLPTETLFEVAEPDLFKSELQGMMNVFQKPLALKGIILNYNIDFLDKLFDKAIFIHTKRDPLTNIASGLKAREKQLGSIDKWYSFKIPEYPELIKLDPYEQVAGQVYHINKAVEEGLSKVAEHKKMTVEYESFCKDPKAVFDELKDKLAANGYTVGIEYSQQASFKVTRKNIGDEKIINAYSKFKKKGN